VNGTVTENTQHGTDPIV